MPGVLSELRVAVQIYGGVSASQQSGSKPLSAARHGGIVEVYAFPPSPRSNTDRQRLRSVVIEQITSGTERDQKQELPHFKVFFSLFQIKSMLALGNAFLCTLNTVHLYTIVHFVQNSRRVHELYSFGGYSVNIW